MMNPFYFFKKSILSAAINSRKKKAPFSAEYSDNFQLSPDAGDDQNNSHYFTLHELDSKRSLFFRLGKRGGNYPNEVWFVFNDGAGNFFIAAKDHYKKDEALPARVECVKAGSTMRFYYDGEVSPAVSCAGGFRADASKPALKAVLTAEFTAATDIFEFSRHMSTASAARALAKEKFTKDFRAALSENHQVHYEQSGVISGSLDIGGKKFVFKSSPAFRDHSYGKRDWDYMDRYLWLVGVLDNGDFFNTSLVRYPAVTELQSGFYKMGGKTVCLKRATPMDKFPADGTVPAKLSYDLEYENGMKIHVEAENEFTVPYIFGKGFICNEGVSNFTLSNGLKGRGITEFSFNADKNRWFHKKR